MYTEISKFPWVEEFEKTIVTSLVTSFGLDFILFKDKMGGDVDTIHNVRSGVWATQQEKLKYEQNENYKDDYRTHSNYKQVGDRDKILKQQGKLDDPYRNKIIEVDEKRNLDHVISAKEVHSDAGRVLAGIDGREIANQSSNLQATQETINKSKKETPINEYLSKLPSMVAGHEKDLARNKSRLAIMPHETPEQQHEFRRLQDRIRKNEEKIKNLKSIDPDSMRKRDAEARAPYNQQINNKYYSSSKFLKSTTKASGYAGLKMGTRQMLGLVLAEIYFEFRNQLPTILDGFKNDFSLERLLGELKDTLQGIWRRVQVRFWDFLISFKDGVFAGIMSSATTTLFNIFATTQRMAAKLIREVWGQLVKAVKLIVFNPDQLSFVDLCKVVVSVLSLGVSTVVGTIVYAQLLPLLSLPFGSALASFISALVTGLVTLGLNYFLIHSDAAKKTWAFVASIIPHTGYLNRFQVINAELDRYLIELGRLELGMDACELEEFVADLESCNNEMQRSMLLGGEVTKRGIELPYEMGNSESTRKWLASLVQ